MLVLSKNGNPLKTLGFKKAMELVRRPDTRLVRMRQNGCGEFVHYIVPGGHVEDAVAEKIKKHGQVIASEDSLWPGHDQTWRIRHTEV